MGNRRFTDEEFDIMVEELIFQKPAGFDMLIHILNVTLDKFVRKRCYEYFPLFKEEMYEDTMQTIYLRFIKKAALMFLLKDGPDGEINRDPDGFYSFMFTVAMNIIRDELKKFNVDWKHRTAPKNDDEDTENKFVDTDDGSLPDIEDKELYRQLLQTSVNIIFSSNSKPHIVLAWVTTSLYILGYGFTKIEANNRFVDDFYYRTLSEMLDFICSIASKIDWLKISDENLEKIKKKLNEKYDDSRTWGEIPLNEFFSSKSPEAVISDWQYKCNKKIREELELGKERKKKEEKKAKTKKKDEEKEDEDDAENKDKKD